MVEKISDAAEDHQRREAGIVIGRTKAINFIMEGDLLGRRPHCHGHMIRAETSTGHYKTIRNGARKT